MPMDEIFESKFQPNQETHDKFNDRLKQID